MTICVCPKQSSRSSSLTGAAVHVLWTTTGSKQAQPPRAAPKARAGGRLRNSSSLSAPSLKSTIRWPACSLVLTTVVRFDPQAVTLSACDSSTLALDCLFPNQRDVCCPASIYGAFVMPMLTAAARTQVSQSHQLLSHYSIQARWRNSTLRRVLQVC